jgi:hypothetical protein
VVLARPWREGGAARGDEDEDEGAFQISPCGGRRLDPMTAHAAQVHHGRHAHAGSSSQVASQAASAGARATVSANACAAALPPCLTTV